MQTGGLGLRTAKQVSLATFVASRVCSRPHISEMATHLTEQGFGDAGTIMDAYDKRTDEATARLVDNRPPSIGTPLIDKFAQAAEGAELRWGARFNPEADSPPQDGRVRRCRPHGIGCSLLPLDEDEDDEHPKCSPTQPGLLHVQRTILQHLDSQGRRDLRKHHTDSGDDKALRRLDGLEHPDCDHTWLWNRGRHAC